MRGVGWWSSATEPRPNREGTSEKAIPTFGLSHDPSPRTRRPNTELVQASQEPSTAQDHISPSDAPNFLKQQQMQRMGSRKRTTSAFAWQAFHAFQKQMDKGGRFLHLPSKMCGIHLSPSDHSLLHLTDVSTLGSPEFPESTVI